MDKGARVVSSAVLGLDMETVIVNGLAYVVFPPTIKKICGAAYWLSKLTPDGKDSFKDLLEAMKDMDSASKALSWFINGDESLADALSEGTVAEVADGLEKSLSLIGTSNFMRLSALSRSVCRLTANTKV